MSFEQERGVTAISVQRGLAQVRVEFGSDNLTNAGILEALGSLAAANVSVDMLKLSDRCLSFIVDESVAVSAEQALSVFSHEVSIVPHRALIGIIAANMRELVGVMTTIAEALATAGAEMEQVGDAHDRVMALIDAERVPGAIVSLQRAFDIEVVAR